MPAKPANRHSRESNSTECESGEIYVHWSLTPQLVRACKTSTRTFNAKGCCAGRNEEGCNWRQGLSRAASALTPVLTGMARKINYDSACENQDIVFAFLDIHSVSISPAEPLFRDVRDILLRRAGTRTRSRRNFPSPAGHPAPAHPR